MALIPILTLVSATSDIITVKDGTGTYSSTNLGGFGTPNPSSSDVSKVLIRAATLATPDSHVPYLLSDPTDIIGVTDGLGLIPGNFAGLSSGETFEDAVYNLKYDLCTTLGTITIAPGASTFTLANADTLLAGVTGLLISTLDATKVWLIDETIALTSTGGSIVGTWPSDADTSQTALKVWEGEVNALIDDAGAKCLATDIALWSDQGCKDDTFRDVWFRYKLKIALEGKFTAGCIQEAHDMALKLADYCQSENCDCGCS